VYTVTISRSPHCSCPDHAKGNVCKHILFTMLRVLRLPQDNPIVWQKALLTKEVRVLPLPSSAREHNDVGMITSGEQQQPGAPSHSMQHACKRSYAGTFLSDTQSQHYAWLLAACRAISEQ
jgi:uncharacterized Zn finger protein